MLKAGDSEGNAGFATSKETTISSSTSMFLRRYNRSSCLDAFHRACENLEGVVMLDRYDVKMPAFAPLSVAAHGTRVDSHTPVVMRFASPDIINAVLEVNDPASNAAGRTIFDDTVTVMTLTAAGKAER